MRMVLGGTLTPNPFLGKFSFHHINSNMQPILKMMKIPLQNNEITLNKKRVWTKITFRILFLKIF